MNVEARGAAQEKALELVFLPTEDDVKEALQARARTGRTRTVRRRALIVLPVAAALNAGEGVLTGDYAGWLPLAAVFVVLGGLVLMGPAVQARKLMSTVAGNGEYRVVVDDTGARIDNACESHLIRWTPHYRYLETDRQFVLLSTDRSALRVGVLPKRGVRAPGTVEGLRALLDQHLTRA